MKAKKVQDSDFDIKKWGAFFLFLIILGGALMFLLKPEGESHASDVINQARLLNRKARELALKTNIPQDMANVDVSTDALEKANALFIESEFTASVDEAQKAIRYAEKVISRGEGGPSFGAKIRFTEISGEVLVRKKGNPDFEAATSRMTLNFGDELRTSETASCKLTHKDGTETLLEPGSRLTFQEDLDHDASESGLALFLEEGTMGLKTTSTASSKLHVRTSYGKALVYHDTEMVARLLPDEDEMEVRVHVGRVDARSGVRSIVVHTNQRFAFSDQRFEGEAEDIPAAPVLKSPVRSSKFQVNQNGFAPIDLSWSLVEGADHYHLQVATDPLFVNLTEEKKRHAGTRVTFPDMQAGTYHWRVTAIDRLNVRGIPSTPSNFEIIASDNNNGTLGGGQPPKLEITDVDVQGNVTIVRGATSRDASVKLNGEVALVDNETGKFHHVLKLSSYGRHRVNIVAESSTGTIAFKTLSVEIKD